MKLCKFCNKHHPLTCFKKNKTYKDGYSNRCNYCVKEYNTLNKEKRSQTHKAWRAKNIERLKLKDSIRDHDPERRFKKSIKVSKRRGLDWHLTLDEFKYFCPLPCIYCANKLQDRTLSTYAALDRVDNSKGYTSDNVIPCCATCNYLRGDILSVNETKELISLLLKLRGLS